MRPIITTRTADHLAARAFEISAIADAVYEAGYGYSSDLVRAAANQVALAETHLREQIEKYARSMLKEPRND